MGYHPETMVCGFPPYASKGGAAWAYRRLKPFIGFDIWHIDPERPSAGQRTDDSCGWFDRRAGEYGDAVAYLLKDESTVWEIRRVINRRAPEMSQYGGHYPRLCAADTLALCLMIARELETRRWWNGQNGGPGLANRVRWPWSPKPRQVDNIAYDLALNPVDNLSTIDEPDAAIGLIAGAMHRKFRPWWRHPRWHVHHWRINFDLPRNLKRMFQPCATCCKPLGFGYCPLHDEGGLHHLECRGIMVGAPATIAKED